MITINYRRWWIEAQSLNKAWVAATQSCVYDMYSLYKSQYIIYNTHIINFKKVFKAIY